MVLLFQQTPLYTASAQILLPNSNTKPPGADTVLPQASFDMAMMSSQMAIIRSTAFLRRVVERNHLASDTTIASTDAGIPGITVALVTYHLVLFVADARRGVLRSKSSLR